MPATIAQVRAFRSCLDINDEPDFTIKIGDHFWHVHSSLLSRQSAFFNKMCNGSFKEAFEHNVMLHEDCPWVVARLIQFLYFGVYDHRQNTHRRYAPSDSGSESDSGTTLDSVPYLLELMKQGSRGDEYTKLKIIDSKRSFSEINALMYAVADKYDVPTLRTAAAMNLKEANFENEDQIFTVLDIVGTSSLQAEVDLFKHMLGEIAPHFIAKPCDYPRLKELLEEDFAITMILLEICNCRISKLEEEVRTKDRALARRHKR